MHLWTCRVNHVPIHPSITILMLRGNPNWWDSSVREKKNRLSNVFICMSYLILLHIILDSGPLSKKAWGPY